MSAPRHVGFVRSPQNLSPYHVHYNRAVVSIRQSRPI